MEQQGHKVLVIDDVVEMGEMVKLLLTHERNDQVEYARGGYQGLAMAQLQRPDLIILDLMMPDLHGYEVFKQLQKMPELQNVPVLLLTVIPSRVVYPEAQQLGISGYLCKPFEIDELLFKII